MKAYLNRLTWFELGVLALFTFVALLCSLNGAYLTAAVMLAITGLCAQNFALSMAIEDRDDDITRLRLGHLDAYRVDEAA